MDLTFASGTATQQKLWTDGLKLLRGMPVDGVPLTIEVSFVPPSEIGQTSFAETTWSYDSVSSVTKVRNDAPGYGGADAALIAEAQRLGLSYDAHQHFNETVAHEFWHSLFAALPEATRLAIAALFGLESDSEEALFPEAADWHDRPGEAMAEVFKEAFLPARYRVFPNRTNIKLSYADYPAFRRLVREAIPSVEAGELAPGEVAVPGYNLDLFEQGTPILTEGPFANPLPGSGGRHGLWDSSFYDRQPLGPPFNTINTGQLQHEAEWQGWVKQGTVITYSVTIPLGVFDPSIIGPPEKVPEPYIGDPYIDPGFLWRILHRPSSGGEYIEDFAGYWSKTLRTPEEIEIFNEFNPTEQPAPEWMLTFDAVGLGIAPVTITGSYTVAAPTFTQTRICRGNIYRLVTLRPQIAGFINRVLTPTEANHIAIREAATYPWIPSLHFTQPSCQGGGEPGLPIVMPEPSVRPLGARAGRARSRGRVSGRR